MTAPTGKLQAVVVVPAHNEGDIIAETIATLTAVGERSFAQPWQLVIVENGSSDDTEVSARRAAAEHPQVAVVTRGVAGKGAAIRHGWTTVPAERYFFIDADLSAEPEVLRQLNAALAAGADVAIGSRVHEGSNVVRPVLRRFLSFCYRLIARALTGTHTRDLPCGVKGMNAVVVAQVLPEVRDQGWFFDSELVLLAEAHGYNITEVPVNWIERRHLVRRSTVPILSVVWHYLRALLVMRRRLRAFPRSRRSYLLVQ